MEVPYLEQKYNAWRTAVKPLLEDFLYSGHNTKDLSIKDTLLKERNTHFAIGANAFWTSQQWKPLY